MFRMGLLIMTVSTVGAFTASDVTASGVTASDDLATATAKTDPAHRAEIDAWHAGRIGRLRSADGWLSLVGLSWLDEGKNEAGSATGADVPLPSSAPARLGTFHREGSAVRFTPAKGVAVKRGGEAFGGGVVASDASGAPDVLEYGSLRLHVIVR